LKVTLFTREYPPDVYGGAGVHVEYLARELSALPGMEVEVRRFASPSAGAAPAETPASREPSGGPKVIEFEAWERLGGEAGSATALRVMSVDLAMAAGLQGTDLVHTHTWYTNLAGHLGKLLHGLPHVVTSHSLEPLRPWKAEQLGEGGYAVSRFCEQTALEAADAVIAVSEAMREDILRTYPGVVSSRIRVIRNGIDPAHFEPEGGTDALRRHGIDPKAPFVLFVGRVTRQKGITYLLDAVADIDRRAQLVLAAAAPDTADLAREVEAKVAHARAERGNVVLIDRMLTHDELVQLMTRATVFVCPSTYEPLGIVNLEAMACETAVVATDTGGIPEVVEDGVTGFLVPFQAADRSGTPRDPARFARDIAERINALIADPELARRFGEAGRRRVIERFSWRAVAERTAELYASLAPDA
jgi:alpha-maltose-1-phosphate synthase